jgi:hypothetical protein
MLDSTVAKEIPKVLPNHHPEHSTNTVFRRRNKVSLSGNIGQ